MAVRIAVEAEHALPRYVLAPPLAALLGFEHETRENITRALWTYIRMHSLQARSPHVLSASEACAAQPRAMPHIRVRCCESHCCPRGMPGAH